MSYSTKFECTVYDADFNSWYKAQCRIAKEIANLPYFLSFGEHPMGDVLMEQVLPSEGLKWYTWQEDMVSISVKYPEQFIKLHGEGEDEDNDVWDAYFLNGKMALYYWEDGREPTFNEADLKEVMQ